MNKNVIKWMIDSDIDVISCDILPRLYPNDLDASRVLVISVLNQKLRQTLTGVRRLLNCNSNSEVTFGHNQMSIRIVIDLEDKITGQSKIQMF